MAEQAPYAVGVPLFIDLSRKLKRREERDGVSPFAADLPAIAADIQQRVETILKTLRLAAFSIGSVELLEKGETAVRSASSIAEGSAATERLLEQAETAVRALDPSGLQTLLLSDIADSWLALGQPDRARTFAQLPPANLATALAQQGRVDEAIHVAGSILALSQRALALSEIAAALQRFGKTKRPRDGRRSPRADPWALCRRRALPVAGDARSRVRGARRPEPGTRTSQ